MPSIRIPVSAGGAPTGRPPLALARVILALALASQPIHAWAADTSGARASSLADTTRPATFLKQTVVTGARYPRAYYESPQALSFLSRGQLLDQAPTVLGDALYGVPGTDMSKDSPWEQRPVLRGLGGQQVLVLMDGNPINSARGNGPHPSLVDPTQVERVEVVRGPSSVAYGSDALGGVINIITRQAPELGAGNSLRGAATIGGSTADQQSNASIQLVPSIGRFSAFLSSGGRKTEDFETPDNGRLPHSSFSDYNGLANLRYALGDRTTLKGGWQLYRGHEIGIPGLHLAIPNLAMDFHFPYYKRDTAHLALEHAFAHSWLGSASAKTYWQSENRDFFSHEEASGIYLPPGPPPGTVRVTDQDRYFKLNTVGMQLQATSQRTERYLVSFGIDANQDQTHGNNVRHRTSYDASGAVYSPTAVRITQSVPTGRFGNYAGFAQSEWFVRPQWTASAGARYTHYRYRADYFEYAPGQSKPPMSIDNDALAGSVGLVFAPRQDLHLSANLANGYRQPNAQELFFNGPASVGNVVGNPGLQPEQSFSGDVGLRWGPRDLALSGNLFYSTYNDLIDAIDITPSPAPPGPRTYQYVNITKARIWGGEAEGVWRFRPQWNARATCTGTVGDNTSSASIQTLYGINASSAPLPNVPPFKGTAALRWTSENGRYWVEPSTRYSWRTNRLPPSQGVAQLTAFKKEWIVGDIFAGARFGSGQRVTLGVRNFTDRAYQLPLASLEEPGISLVGTLSTDF